MNKIKIYLLFVGVISLIFGCNEIDQTYGGPWFVYTEAESGEVFESDPKTLSIPVFVSSDDYLTQTEVTFKVESENATEGVDFEIVNVGRDLIYEPGVAVQNIDIKLMDNDETDGDLEVTISLVSTNKADYEIGKPGPDNTFSSYVLTILDDDCPFVPEDYSKSLDGLETCIYWTDIKSPFVFEYLGEVSENVYRYNVTGFWYAQLEGSEYAWVGDGDSAEYLPIEAIIDLSDPTAPTIEIKGGIGAMLHQDGDAYSYEVKATKTALFLSTCKKEMRFPYQMVGMDWANGMNFDLKFDFN
ncbi:MAG: hypothetical protein JEZ14_10575 [Marinilabiliaceae bacterium]|nr:hypothetical protein [Marinilabiliaceae bacterium]